uniref:Uncharacterized protein n=1 Tax=Arundo donax TaxID=35708 RepID=A0A0A9CUN8_ARUDO
MIDEMIMGSIVGSGAVIRPLWSVKRIIGELRGMYVYISRKWTLYATMWCREINLNYKSLV